MNDEQIRHGSTVWITDGLDKGRKGVVDMKGFNVVSVQLEGDLKMFSISSVTTKDPNSVPLPPNFLPTTFGIGDKVEAHDCAQPIFNGIVGTIVKLPTTTSRSVDFGQRAYHVSVANPGKSGYRPGYILHFHEDNLKKASVPERVEGEEIAHDQVRIGDTIRTELKSTDENYSHVSSKEGKVNRITRKNWPHSGESFAKVYSFATDRNHGLTFGHDEEKIILVKAAESPYINILKNLDKGTVVVFEKEGGEVLTYVKSVPWLKFTQWHEISSLSGRSSTFVTEDRIVNLLDRGVAEIAHKVRKPVKAPACFPPPPTW